MVLRDSDHCFGAFSGYSLAIGSTETPGNRDDLTDFCPVLRAGTKADLEKTVGKPVETVPQIFLDQKHIGGCTDFEAYAKEHLGLFAAQ